MAGHTKHVAGLTKRIGRCSGSIMCRLQSAKRSAMVVADKAKSQRKWMSVTLHQNMYCCIPAQHRVYPCPPPNNASTLSADVISAKALTSIPRGIPSPRTMGEDLHTVIAHDTLESLLKPLFCTPCTPSPKGFAAGCKESWCSASLCPGLRLSTEPGGSAANRSEDVRVKSSSESPEAARGALTRSSVSMPNRAQATCSVSADTSTRSMLHLALSPSGIPSDFKNPQENPSVATAKRLPPKWLPFP
mmetsp:Transcript_28972/g.67739  ORF Transcript_28972/g.67739 Transcript_28972/m.67739 type:complete len:246 (+) Transcript_28972:367-1104(+)